MPLQILHINPTCELLKNKMLQNKQYCKDLNSFILLNTGVSQEKDKMGNTSKCQRTHL